MTYTKKAIRELINCGIAEDITNYSFEQGEALRKSADLETVGTSHGTYGMTGAILRDRKTGKQYAITARNSLLFQMV